MDVFVEKKRLCFGLGIREMRRGSLWLNGFE